MKTSVMPASKSTSLLTQRQTDIFKKAREKEPLLLRVAKGEVSERIPVWMMRQAGRHMKAYRDLCLTHKSFRDRSENAAVATEISLQPFREYGTDGCILFSDILTPLPAMGVEFDIAETVGPKLRPMTTMEAALSIKPLAPSQYTPFVGETLRNLRAEVGNNAAVLGFIGLPFTLATYLVEGGSSSEFKGIKTFSYNNPRILHEMLGRLADNVADYAIYQIEHGAQIIQLFDSWAGTLSPEDYHEFAAQYQTRVVNRIKASHPEVPLIMYIKHSGSHLDKIAQTGVDIVSLDWTVDIANALQQLQKYNKNIGVQGNLDPMVLLGSTELIKSRTRQLLSKSPKARHIMNLGHGIDPSTPESNAKLFVDTVKQFSR